MSLLKQLINRNLIEENLNVPLIENSVKEDLCYADFKYFNNCDERLYKKGNKNFFNWDCVKYLDFKLSENIFESNESTNCLKNFLINGQNKKILHVVNGKDDYKSIFDFEEWPILVDYVNTYISKNTILEIVNKMFHKPIDKDEYSKGLSTLNFNSEVHYFLFKDKNNFMYNFKWHSFT